MFVGLVITIFILYIIDNQNVGILLAYSSNDVEKLDKPMLEHLRRKKFF